MEETIASPVKPAMKWGLIMGGIYCVITVISYFLGNFQPENAESPAAKVMAYGMYAIMIFLLVVGMQQHRDKDLGGYMTYSRGLGFGALTGLFYGIIAAILLLVVYTWMVPADYFDRVMDLAMEKALQQNPDMTPDQMAMGKKIANFFMNPPMLAITALITGVVSCFFFSLLISALVKKANPNEVI